MSVEFVFNKLVRLNKSCIPSYGGTDRSAKQQQAFLKALCNVFPSAAVYSYPEAAVDPEGAAAFESRLQLWNVLIEVPFDLVAWLQSEIAAIGAEGFALDLMPVEEYSL